MCECNLFFLILIHVNAFQERIQDDKPALSGICGQHVATILSSLVGKPPDLGLLASITDFLLQIHPASSGFINHSPNIFYLYPKWGKSYFPIKCY